MKTLNIYTAQIGKYDGPDAVDITVKSGDRVFAPVWDLVMGWKNKKLTWEEYTAGYRTLMLQSYAANKDRWLQVLGHDEVTFTCYCRIGDNCHRDLLAEFFRKLGEKQGIAVSLCGPRAAKGSEERKGRPASSVEGMSSPTVSPCGVDRTAGCIECLSCWELDCRKSVTAATSFKESP